MPVCIVEKTVHEGSEGWCQPAAEPPLNGGMGHQRSGDLYGCEFNEEKFFIPSNEADARLEIVAAKPQHERPLVIKGTSVKRRLPPPVAKS